MYKKKKKKEEVPTMKYELHHHTGYSLNDGFGNSAETKKFCEMNGIKAIALTDHGHVMSHDDFRNEFAGSGTKLLFGVECYLQTSAAKAMNVAASEDAEDVDELAEQIEDEDGDTAIAHFLMLAKDYQGLQAIYRMVTAAYDNMQGNVVAKPVLTQEVLTQYCAPGKPGHGHIIALSACMQGVLSVEALYNANIDRQAEKILRRRDRLQFDIDAYSLKVQQLDEMQEQLDDIKARRQLLNTLKNKKYTARKKAVEKLQGTPSYATELAQLEAEMAESAQAAAEFDAVKEQESVFSKQVTGVRAEVRKMAGKCERWQAIGDQAEELRSHKVDEMTLFEKTMNAAMYYNAIFGEGNFYAELQYHGIPQEQICYPMVAQVAETLNIPVVATNDSHILANSADNRMARQILRSLRFNKWEDEMTGDSELYIKSDDEMREALEEILPPYIVDQAIENTAVIAEQCNVEFPSEEHYPKFVSDDKRPALEILRDMSFAKFEELKKTLPRSQWNEYQERIEYELSVIDKLGVSDYLLIVQDFLEYGRLLGRIDLDDPKFLADPYNIPMLKEMGKGKVGMSIGLGRGSAVGSLVCYLVGIVNADPIKYNLLFERFLNTERVTMPKQYWAFSVNFIAQRCAA